MGKSEMTKKDSLENYTTVSSLKSEGDYDFMREVDKLMSEKISDYQATEDPKLIISQLKHFIAFNVILR